jgi:hypothetical protein
MRDLPGCSAIDRRDPLPAPLRCWLEAGLGDDLGEVRLHRGPAAARLAAEAGGLACAIGGRDIFLGDVPAAFRRAVIAHEAAHILQQRRAGPAVPGHAAEAEAHRAARAVLAGGMQAPRLGLDPRDPACWGEAGHYYTVYYVALAANVPDGDAYNIAFWAQVADEVEELNAVPAGLAMAWEDVTSYAGDRYHDFEVGFSNFNREIILELQRGMPGGPVYVPGRAVPQYKRSQSYSDWLDVQRGLHALTGRAAESETTRRTQITLSYKPSRGQIFQFGLSLHPLGDSFAHRNGERMYDPPEGHGLHGHTPDELGDHRRKLYHLYVRKLHEVMTGGFGTAGSARLSADQAVAALDTIIPPRPTPDQIRVAAMAASMSRNPFAYSQALKAYGPDEKTQIRQIRGLASGLGGGITTAYNPERFESVDFSDFKAPSGISVPTTLVMEARRLSREWSY